MATECDFEAYRELPTQPGDRRRDFDPSSDRPEPAAAEREFLAAIGEYRRTGGRLFPTWSEVLEVARGLGYHDPDGREGPR